MRPQPKRKPEAPEFRIEPYASFMDLLRAFVRKLKGLRK